MNVSRFEKLVNVRRGALSHTGYLVGSGRQWRRHFHNVVELCQGLGRSTNGDTFEPILGIDRLGPEQGLGQIVQGLEEWCIGGTTGVAAWCTTTRRHQRRRLGGWIATLVFVVGLAFLCPGNGRHETGMWSGYSNWLVLYYCWEGLLFVRIPRTFMESW